MKTNKKKSTKKIKVTVAILFGMMWIIIALFSYINNPHLQSQIYKSINKVSRLNIKSAHLNINFFRREVSVTDISLHNPTKNQQFLADKVSFNFGILPLLKGTLKIKDLRVTSLSIRIGEPLSVLRKKESKISIPNLLFLNNISVQNGVINHISVETPKFNADVEKIELNYTPSFLKNVRLALKIKSPSFEINNHKFESDEISVRGSTDVNKWIDAFPYVDDLKGKITAKEINLEDFNIDQLTVSLKYNNKKVELNRLVSNIRGNNIIVSGSLNGHNGNYDFDIDIPQPVNLPSIGPKRVFFDTSGRIEGMIKIKGSGLDYKTTDAVADLSLTHSLTGEEDLPAKITGQAEIERGIIHFSDINLLVLETDVSVGGSFNYLKPTMDLNFSAKDIAVEAVLNRFRDKYYEPASGIADVEGKFTGWKPNLKFELNADISPGRYYDIEVDRATMDLLVTYDNIKLDGSLYQGEEEIGLVKLDIDKGEKRPDGSRRNQFELKAEVHEHELSQTMGAYDLKGLGKGSLHLHGQSRKYSGTGDVKIKNGSFKGIGFNELQSDIGFATKEITFSSIKLAAAGANPTTFTNPLHLDIENYGIHFHGNLSKSLQIDAKYFSNNGSWKIADITYSGQKNSEWTTILKGSVSKAGELNLTLNGILDSSLLSSLRGLVREASGPIHLDEVQVRGTSNSPALYGNITFTDSVIHLRELGYYLDKIEGKLILDGHSIDIEELNGRIEYGNFKLAGNLKHRDMSISYADLDFLGDSIMYSNPERTFRVEMDADLHLEGKPTSSHLNGKINIIDGRYTKNFSIFESLKSQPSYEEEDISQEVVWKNITLDLDVNTDGDLVIDNNIGEIWLNADLKVKGTRDDPKIIGNIDTVGGEIDYAGIDFEVTQGFVEFKDPYDVPYIEFGATEEVDRYSINLTIRGPINKLRLDLSSTPPLEQKDILALLTFGITKDDLDKAKFGYQLGTGLVAEQVTAVLGKPVTRFTPLDTFRIETSPTGDSGVTRVSVGKEVSDRLKINFITDINSADAEQMFQAEYLITDFLLLKGLGSSDANYRFNLTFRFKED